DNVESVTVLWPAPKKFDDGAGGTALGYKQQVVLPLRIVAKNADKPVTRRPQSAAHPRRQARGKAQRAGRRDRARGQGGQPVRRGTDARLGAAGSQAGRAKPARRQTLYLRTRRPAARRQR